MANIIDKKNDVAAYFMQPGRQKQLEMALPSVGITKDRMLRLMFSALVKTPKLLSCTPESLYNSMIQCASMGLEPNTELGQAYLIPFKDKVQLIVGYRGYITLARRSGEISTVSAHLVREKDCFSYEYGTNEYLRHRPAIGERGDMLAVYCVAKLRDGSSNFEVMSISEIDAIRARSQSGSTGPWVTDYPQMARKTAIRRLMHYLPLSSEIAQAITIDGKNEVGEQGLGMLGMENIAEPAEQKPSGLRGMAEQAEQEQQDPAIDGILEKLGQVCGGEEKEMLVELKKMNTSIKKLGDLRNLSSDQLDDIAGMAGLLHDEWEAEARRIEKEKKKLTKDIPTNSRYEVTEQVFSPGEELVKIPQYPERNF